MSSFAKQSKIPSSSISVKKDPKAKFSQSVVKKSLKPVSEAKRLLLDVPVFTPPPPPLPSTGSTGGFDYYLISKEGTPVPVPPEIIMSVDESFFNTDGTVSTYGQSQGLVAVAHPGQSNYTATPQPVSIKSPDLQSIPMATPHHIQDSSTPLPPGATANYFATLPDGHVLQISDANRDRLIASHLILPDGSISQRGIDSGLTRVITPAPITQSVPAPVHKTSGTTTNWKAGKSGPTGYIVPSPDKLTAPHHNQDAATPLPNGAIATYFMTLQDGNLKQLSDQNLADLKASGTIRQDGSIVQRAIDAGLTRVVTPVQLAQSTPALIHKDSGATYSGKSGTKSPTGHYISPTKDIINEPNHLSLGSTPIPPGASVNYFMRLPDGSTRQITDKNLAELKASGAIRQDGSIAQRAINAGLTRVVTPPLPIQNVPHLEPQKPAINTSTQVNEPNYFVKKTPNTHIVYFAPKLSIHNDNEREVLNTNELHELAKNNQIHPDGSLSASAIQMGYTSTIIVENNESAKIPVNSDTETLQRHFRLAQTGHEDLIKHNLGQKADDHLGLGKKGFNWLWLLLLIPIIAYILKRSKTV